MNFEDFAGPEPPVNDSYRYWWERMRLAWNGGQQEGKATWWMLAKRVEMLKVKADLDRRIVMDKKECKCADKWREMAMTLAMELEYALDDYNAKGTVPAKTMREALAEYHKLENPCNATDVS